MSRSGHNPDLQNPILIGRLIQAAQTSKNLTQDLLSILKEGLEGSLNAVTMHDGHAMHRDMLLEDMAWQERRRIEKTINHLIATGLLEISKQGALGISEKGQIVALRDAIAQKRKKLPKNRFCLVAFDIPEDKNDSRKSFRRMLKDLGFSPHQRSLWISQKNVTHELNQLFLLMDINRDWITIYEATMLF